MPFVCLAPMCVSCGFGVVSPDNGCHTQLPTARPARAFAESFAVHFWLIARAQPPRHDAVNVGVVFGVLRVWPCMWIVFAR